MQELLFRHFEKGIFAVLVAVSGLLVYSGLKMPNYLDKQKPDAMEQGANQVKQSIDEDHWAQILETEDRVTAVDVVARTNESIRPVSAQTYQLLHPWEGKLIDSNIRRDDPQLLAPIELRVKGVIASLALKSQDGDYALLDLDNAEPIEKAPEPRRTDRRRGGRRGAGMMEGMEGMGGEEEMMQMEMGMPGGGAMEMPGMDVMGGMGGGTMAAARRLDAKKFDQGYRPTVTANSNLVPAMGHFIAGVAVMPHKEIFAAFDAALRGRDGHDPRRDQPVYLGFQLQRADVTDKSVDELTDADWQLRLNSTFYRQLLLRLWAGFAKEIVSGKYRDPELTTPIPPVLLEHYAHFASHPKIPLGDEDPRARLQQRDRALDAPVGPLVPDAGEDPSDLFGRRTTRPGMGGGMAGMGMPGMDMGMPGMDMGMPGMGMGMPGMDMGMPGMMGGFGGMAGATIESQPDYKLIRFYDFGDISGRDRAAPQVGRKYVYRIRVAIEDPNFPKAQALRPSNSTLSAEVFRRVEQERAKGNRGSTLRWTEFSEPSPVASLPPLTEAFVGPVVPPSVRRIRDVDVITKPASGKVVGTKWDAEFQVPLPLVMEVGRGTVLAQKGEINIPDPLTLNVKKLPDAEVNLESVVVDLGGGQPLEISVGEGQTAPSWMLLYDANGGLRVMDEISSQKGYRMYSFADDRGE